MNNTWKETDFFYKMQSEGGFEGLADYMGSVEIETNSGDPLQDMTETWHTFCLALQDLQSFYEDWESVQPEGEDD